MKQFLKTIIWPVMAAPAIYLAISWKNIPEVVPMHYNLKGEVDRYGSRNELFWLVVILTVVSVLTYLLLLNVHRFDPKRKSAEFNKKRMASLALGIAFFLSIFNAMMIYYCSHPEVSLKSNLILAVVGLLFAFIGNYMHSIKPNYFAGLRLPWTLENEENWRLTHALAGKLWFAGGLLITIISIIASSQVAVISLVAIVMILVLIPCIYSYRLYKKQRSQTV